MSAVLEGAQGTLKRQAALYLPCLGNTFVSCGSHTYHVTHTLKALFTGFQSIHASFSSDALDLLAVTLQPNSMITIHLLSFLKKCKELLCGPM